MTCFSSGISMTCFSSGISAGDAGTACGVRSIRRSSSGSIRTIRIEAARSAATSAASARYLAARVRELQY